MTIATRRKLKIELCRLANNPDPRVQAFLKAMSSRYPFLFSSLEKTG